MCDLDKAHLLQSPETVQSFYKKHTLEALNPVNSYHALAEENENTHHETIQNPVNALPNLRHLIYHIKTLPWQSHQPLSEPCEIPPTPPPQSHKGTPRPLKEPRNA